MKYFLAESHHYIGEWKPGIVEGIAIAGKIADTGGVAAAGSSCNGRLRGLL